MSRRSWFVGLSVLLCLGAPVLAEGLDAAKLDAALGMKGTQKDGEYKVSVPQKDLRVTVDGFTITPYMGLTSRVGFAPHGGQAMAMGDVVLLEDEFKAVEQAAIGQGLTVTEEPRIIFLHFWGVGSTASLSKGLRAALDETGKE